MAISFNATRRILVLLRRALPIVVVGAAILTSGCGTLPTKI